MLELVALTTTTVEAVDAPLLVAFDAPAFAVNETTNAVNAMTTAAVDL